MTALDCVDCLVREQSPPRPARTIHNGHALCWPCLRLRVEAAKATREKVDAALHRMHTLIEEDHQAELARFEERLIAGGMSADEAREAMGGT